MKRIARFLAGMVIGLAVLALLALNALLVWVATGPRDLSKLSPYLEEAFVPADAGYSLSIGQTWLIWDGWKHPVDIRLRNVRVLTARGEAFSNFPEISVGLDVPWLMLGKVLPTSLTVMHPVISLYQNDDRSLSFGVPTQGAAEQPEAKAAFPPKITEDGSLRKLRFITILNADISVGNAKDGVFFRGDHADIVFKRAHGGRMQALASAQVAYGEYRSTVDSEFTLEKDGPVLHGEVRFAQVMPAALAGLFMTQNPLAPLQLPLSGRVEVSFTREGVLSEAGFTIDGGEGRIVQEKLASPLHLHGFHAEGSVGEGGHAVTLASFAAGLDHMTLDAAGKARFAGGDMSMDGDAALKGALASDVALLWPPDVSPESRHWIISNITDGNISEAKVHVAIKPGDRALPVLPKEDIEASVAIDGAVIRYLPDHPPMSDVAGVVHVNSVALKADITGARYMNATQLTAGTLSIDDLNVDNPYIAVDFTADSTAKDIVRFLGLPRLMHAAKLNLTQAATGTLSGSAKVGFRFFAPRDAAGNPIGEPDVDFDVTAEMKDVSQPGFMKKFDIEHASGSMHVTNSELEFKGGGVINGADVSAADIRYVFKAENGFDTFIDADAVAPVESLTRFGYPTLSFLGGALGVHASVKQGDTQEISKASFDLTEASVKLPHLRWDKKIGEPASFAITAEKKNGLVTIPGFTLKGADMDARGSAALKPDLSDLQSVTVERIVHGDTDLDHLEYEVIDGGYRIVAKGKSADIGPWVESNDQEESSFSFEHFPAFQVKGEVGRLVLGKGRVLSDVKAGLDCDVAHCNRADIGGKTADGKGFSFRILRNPAGQRQLSLHAQSAGAFLRAINLFDGMEGGDLTVTGNYGEEGLKGKASISEYLVHDAPILGKILSLASPTGFIDMLGGKGIRFVRLRAPFAISRDVITIEEAETNGPAIGMTMAGIVTFPKQALDLHGTIVPSYTLNSIVGRVPLIGEALTGGEGQGLFAARYSIKGSARDPSVSVNPLSMLTPGFLRGLFDVFDGGGKKDEVD